MKMLNYLSTLTTSVCLILISQPLVAAETEQLSKTDIKEKWGQVIFCQSIYKMPEVKSRLYDFDLEQCNAAGQLALEVVAKYTPDEQRGLKFQAEKHARAISYNTSEPYHSVSACREYCRKLSELLEKMRSESGQEAGPGE